MLKKRYGPSYELEEVKRMVSEGRASSTKRVRGWLSAHGFDPAETISDVICSLEDQDFVKCDELNVIPGVFADIYKTSFEDEDWYVKFFVDAGTVRVRVFSCCIDGAIH